MGFSGGGQRLHQGQVQVNWQELLGVGALLGFIAFVVWSLVKQSKKKI